MRSRERVIDKIAKLMRASREDSGRTEEETQVFAAKIQALLIEHEIEMSEIPMEERDIREETVDQEEFRPSERGWTSTKNQWWLRQVADAVARAHMCQLIVDVYENRVWFIGKPHNRAVACFMYEYLIRSARNLNYIAYTTQAREHKRQYGDTSRLDGFIAAFYESFAHTIHDRYEERRHQADVINSTALILRSTEVAIRDWVKSQNLAPAAHLGAKGSTNAEGRSAGERAARDIDLDRRGVGSRQTGRLS